MKISGFVIGFNREAIIETCLRSISFVDELIVIDKSSTDRTPDIARKYADRLITVPWSPSVEETRKLAAEQCRHDAIVFLDDDECFSPEAIEYLDHEMRQGSGDLYAIPCRHHIIGRHDESAYYWPERHVRAFRRGALTFSATVHGGQRRTEGATVVEPGFDSGICFHNISHPDASTWIEKTNRYTSMRDRAGSVDKDFKNILSEARTQIDHWFAKCNENSTSYAQAVVLLRAVYDLVDIVKHWEQKDDRTGHEMFAEFCAQTQKDYDAFERRTGIATTRHPDASDASTKTLISE